MRVAAALAAAAWLAACSGAEEQQSAAAMGNAAEPAATAQTPAPVSATGSGMRGTVSSLTGAVSGLNTRVTDMGLVIDLPSDALFEFDKATLTSAAEDQLRKATDLIRRSPPGALKVIGHTDDKGDDAYNQKLSVARAQAVADWLGQQVGVRTRGFEVTGKGESEPVAPNARPDGSDDPAGRAKNRRVEVVVPNGG
jgi:outer membrane protein OmpA-like peptidoglycan-associated protein